MSILRALSRDPAQPPPAPPFELSPIGRTHRWWRYLWPFHSRKAFWATLCAIVGGLLAWTIVVVQWFDLHALPWVLIGGLLGATALGPHRALPAQMTITTRNEARCLFDDVERIVKMLRYELGSPTGTAGHVQYRHKWHGKWNGWLAGDEHTVDIRWREHEIEVHGPIYAIEWLRSRLLNQLDL